MSKQCYGYRTNSTNPDDAANPSYVFPLPSDQAVPCPSNDSDNASVACCRPGDKCLANNICGCVNYVPPGYSYPYYMGSCTDPSFTAGVCPLICTTQVQPGIVYLSNSRRWACCGAAADGQNYTCNTPTDIVFSAPEPDKLTSYGTAGTNTEKGKSLSTGTIAGIGAGAGVAGLILLAVLVRLLLRYTKKKRARTEARIWLAGGRKVTSNGENPNDGLVPEVNTISESQKHEYRVEEMLPMYSEGEHVQTNPQHSHPTVAELGGRETSNLMGIGQRAELGGRETSSLMFQRAELEAYR